MPAVTLWKERREFFLNRLAIEKPDQSKAKEQLPIAYCLLQIACCFSRHEP